MGQSFESGMGDSLPIGTYLLGVSVFREQSADSVHIPCIFDDLIVVSVGILGYIFYCVRLLGT